MPIRCLIVDDNSLFLEAASDLLDREGLDVVGVASNTTEARRLVEELRPDVTLVDIDLGDEDGFELARRNQALEDFAALVAHELKTPLQAALVADDPSRPVGEALDLVDELLEAAQDVRGERASVGECLDQAVEDLGAEVEITTDLGTTLPIPPGPLRVILRNLLSNALAAGARHVHVATVRSLHSWRVLLDDDGIGLEIDGYASGSGLGLALSRRIADRFDGTLELAPRPSGGTRATLELAEAAR